jgi:hypothetical protein
MDVRRLPRVPVRADLVAVVSEIVRPGTVGRLLVIDEPPEVLGRILLRRLVGLLVENSPDASIRSRSSCSRFMFEWWSRSDSAASSGCRVTVR